MASIHSAALRCLSASEPADKLEATRATVAAWRGGELAIAGDDDEPPLRIERPGRPARPQLVPPRQLPNRGLGTAGGRAALIHAVAHIEFNAIDLAWDAVYRFRGLPRAYYDDWLTVADDEARHFGWLTERLTHYGHCYGDFDAHNGLWEMAVATDDDCLRRMALVPRVLEARGLDVTPAMIERVRAAGDDATAAVLAQILSEEVAHVATGSRWFAWLCAQRGLDSRATFGRILAEQGGAALRGPFNRLARQQAGFSSAELDDLERLAVP